MHSHSNDNRPELGEFAALQWTRTELCRLLRDFFHQTRPQGAPPIRVGTDVPFYYDPADKLARVTPDLYVIEGLGYEEQLRSYRVWERGAVPHLVVHLVDSAMSPDDGLMMHFRRLGTTDIVLYDPLWYRQPPSAPGGRRLLWHYRNQGDLVLLRQEHPARVYLPRYGIWLCHRGGAELRVYVDPSNERNEAGPETAPETTKDTTPETTKDTAPEKTPETTKETTNDFRPFPAESACWPTPPTP